MDGSVGRSPRVWPIFAVYAGALATMAVIAMPLAPLIAGLSQEDLLVVSGALSSLVLVTFAWVAGEPWRPRLAGRLALSGEPFPWGRTVAYSLGVLGLSQALGSAIVLAGLSESGMLSEMTRALQEAPLSFLPTGLLVLGLGAGTCEEIFFRGYMQTRLAARAGPALAVLITALLFGVAHLDWIQSPAAAGMGLYLGWIRQRSGSVWPAVAAHAVNNAAWLILARLGELPAASHGALLVLGLALAAGVVLKDRAESG